ncbi:MAG TPA: 4'-phosphopantetheinyl transferase superfamily protein [Kofleriaceae bacterium]|nr:4'-phosphopantetheinyl transferase superfamily protein [Kofleriaceae bacterium]
MLRSVERLALAHGACVIIELADPEAALAALDPAEQAHASLLGAPRRHDYIAGRTALHLALGSPAPILSDVRGAPIIPDGWVGSVSHKGAFAAALVARAGLGHIGVDLERAAPPRVDLAPRILTPRELAAVPDRGRAVTLRFAIKEAIYKAVDPYVRRYVGFTEVELDLDPEREPDREPGHDLGPAHGAVRVSSELPLAIEATWREHAGHWLATARAVRR